LSNLTNSLYIPFFIEYSEYDFQNWSSIELLEDIFWESSYGSTNHDEYFSIKQGVYAEDFLKKQELLFNNTIRSLKDRKLKSGILSKQFFMDLTGSRNIASLPIFLDESLVNTQSLKLKDFNQFSNEYTLENTEEVYDSAKYMSYLYYLNYKNILNSSSNSIQPISYATIFDSFRSNYEDFYLYMDENLLGEKNVKPFIFENALDTNQNLRLSNPLKLRSSIKNAIVTFNAIQKVFKSRFDELRSNARLEDFSNSAVKHPFITDNRIGYESLLGKNKESFLKINLYNHLYRLNFSNIIPLHYATNVYFTELPFLISMKSDPSRYLWFDWQSRWSSIEVAASSVSRYSLLGLPYSTKLFEYTTNLSDELSESESYLIKLSKARKNYTTNWSFTPFFFLRVNN